MHDFTPTAFQNIEVLEPILTVAGTAVIYTFGGTVIRAGLVLAAVEVLVEVFEVADGAEVPASVPAFCAGVAAAPALYPRAVQILS